jgi:hypothetical protein
MLYRVSSCYRGLNSNHSGLANDRKLWQYWALTPMERLLNTIIYIVHWTAAKILTGPIHENIAVALVSQSVTFKNITLEDESRIACHMPKGKSSDILWDPWDTDRLVVITLKFSGTSCIIIQDSSSSKD